MRSLALILLLLACSPVLGQIQEATASLSQDQIRDLIRQASEHDIDNDKRQRDYTYIEREEEHKLDGKGNTKSSRVEDAMK